MKNQRSQSLTRHVLFKAVAPSFALMFLCSCTLSVYDMRQLDQPVVLNNNPFLLSGTATPPKTVNVDTYSATVLSPHDKENSDGTVTTSTTNTAQLNAFLKIGGEPKCFIHNVSLDLTRIDGAIPSDFEAHGEVAQIQPPLAPPRVHAGESSTNQPVLPSTDQK